MRRSPNFDFLGLKNLLQGQFLGNSNSRRYYWILKLVSGSETVCGFCPWLCPCIPAGMYLLKVNNINTRTRCEVCSKLRIKIPELRHWRRFGIFIVNFEHISRLVLVFLLLALNMQVPTGQSTPDYSNWQNMSPYMYWT